MFFPKIVISIEFVIILIEKKTKLSHRETKTYSKKFSEQTKNPSAVPPKSSFFNKIVLAKLQGFMADVSH